VRIRYYQACYGDSSVSTRWHAHRPHLGQFYPAIVMVDRIPDLADLVLHVATPTLLASPQGCSRSYRKRSFFGLRKTPWLGKKLYRIAVLGPRNKTLTIATHRVYKNTLSHRFMNKAKVIRSIGPIFRDWVV
jgi:hypothetical protein